MTEYASTNVSHHVYSPPHILAILKEKDDLLNRVLVVDVAIVRRTRRNTSCWAKGALHSQAENSSSGWQSSHNNLSETLRLSVYVWVPNPSVTCSYHSGSSAYGIVVAEKTFLNFRAIAPSHPNIQFISISHSDRESTDRWLASLPEPLKNTVANLEIIIDTERTIYSSRGLGISSFWLAEPKHCSKHILSYNNHI